MKNKCKDCPYFSDGKCFTKWCIKEDYKCICGHWSSDHKLVERNGGYEKCSIGTCSCLSFYPTSKLEVKKNDKETT